MLTHGSSHYFHPQVGARVFSERRSLHAFLGVPSGEWTVSAGDVTATPAFAARRVQHVPRT